MKAASKVSRRDFPAAKHRLAVEVAHDPAFLHIAARDLGTSVRS